MHTNNTRVLDLLKLDQVLKKHTKYKPLLIIFNKNAHYTLYYEIFMQKIGTKYLHFMLKVDVI